MVAAAAADDDAPAAEAVEVCPSMLADPLLPAPKEAGMVLNGLAMSRMLEWGTEVWLVCAATDERYDG